MKFQLSHAFERDFRRLSQGEQRIVKGRLPDFVAACDTFASDPGSGWPAGLRVKPVIGAPGVWEMTFSFAGPDVRATFEWTTIDGERAVRWRRIGGHAIFDEP
ncbi:MAG: hypothetical protein KF809_03810 [Chloroflexi bacterium]|nr:hypothetical protein [Chloroflexota bacterium]